MTARRWSLAGAVLVLSFGVGARAAVADDWQGPDTPDQSCQEVVPWTKKLGSWPAQPVFTKKLSKTDTFVVGPGGDEGQLGGTDAHVLRLLLRQAKARWALGEIDNTPGAGLISNSASVESAKVDPLPDGSQVLWVRTTMGVVEHAADGNTAAVDGIVSQDQMTLLRGFVLAPGAAPRCVASAVVEVESVRDAKGKTAVGRLAVSMPDPWHLAIEPAGGTLTLKQRKLVGVHELQRPGAFGGGALGLGKPDGGFETVFVAPQGLSSLGDGLKIPSGDDGHGERFAFVRRAPVEERAGDHGSGLVQGAAPAAAKSPHPDCRGKAESRVWFASRRAISFEGAYDGKCDDGQKAFAYRVARTQEIDAFGRLGGLARIPDVDGKEGANLQAHLSDLARKTLRGSDCLSDDVDVRLWGVARQPGKWIVRGALWPAREPRCQGKSAFFDLPDALPESLTGPAGLPAPFAALAASHPGLLDAAASPDGRMLVLLFADRVALEVGGKTVATRPGRYALLMAVWIQKPHDAAAFAAAAAKAP